MGIFLIAIILFVLILSILFGDSLDRLMGISNRSEGFISYNVSGTIGTDVSLAVYSNKAVTKLYDNIYVDKTNAFLIGINGPSATAGASGEYVSASGELIQNIRIYPRTATPTDYVFTSSLEIVNRDTTTTTTNTHFVADFTSGSSKYAVLYVSLENTTFIHIIDNTDIKNMKDLETFKVTTGGVIRKSQNADIGISDVRSNTEYAVSTDDGSYIESTKVIYGRPVQKLGGKFYYDLSSGSVTQVYLVGVQNKDSYMELTTRPNSDTDKFTMKRKTDVIAPTELGSIENISFTTKLYEDDFVRLLQIADGKNTVLVLYYLSNGAIKLHSVYRYKESVSVENIKLVNNLGADQLSLAQLTEYFLKIMEEYNKNMGRDGTGSGSGIDDISTSEEYAKWLAYWKTEAGKTTDANMSDYTLKTMIVPPVCPTCPNCPSCGKTDGSCSSCAGKNGSSSSGSGSSGSSSAAGIKADDSELSRLAASTGKGATDLARETVGGATDLARETATGATGLARETVGGAVGLARETVGGALDLVREAGGEVKGLFRGWGPTQVGNVQIGGQGQGQYYGGPQAGGFDRGVAGEYGVPTRGSSNYPGGDPLSYYGSLVPKGSNFVAITADFSKFGR